MSSQKPSRAFAKGRVKAIRRMKQPMVVYLEASAPPRNPVARAHAARSASGGAGRHIHSQGAQRRADRMQLQRSLRQFHLE